MAKFKLGNFLKKLFTPEKKETNIFIDPNQYDIDTPKKKSIFQKVVKWFTPKEEVKVVIPTIAQPITDYQITKDGTLEYKDNRTFRDIFINVQGNYSEAIRDFYKDQKLSIEKDTQRIIIIMVGYVDDSDEESFISDVYTNNVLKRYTLKHLIADSINSLKYRTDSAGEDFILQDIQVRITLKPKQKK
jgi:hypothetical protein